MKDWIYFYIEHTIKYGEPFYKEADWSLGLHNIFIVLSLIKSKEDDGQTLLVF